MSGLKDMPDEYWRDKLSPDLFRIARGKATETPYSGKYLNFDSHGNYHCAACNKLLFTSKDKFEDASGWPSFSSPDSPDSVFLQKDDSHGMRRTEVICASCGAHLGHLFADGPIEKGGMHYCVNSLSLDFQPDPKK